MCKANTCMVTEWMLSAKVSPYNIGYELKWGRNNTNKKEAGRVSGLL